MAELTIAFDPSGEFHHHMTDPIATREILSVDPEGEQTLLTIHIGRPVPITDQPGSDWRCPVTIPFHQERNIYGVDSWQALCLALCLVQSQLTNFVRRGGKFYHPGSTDEFAIADFTPATLGD